MEATGLNRRTGWHGRTDAALALVLILSVSCTPAGTDGSPRGERAEPPPARSVDPQASPDAALVAAYRDEGLSHGQAIFAALSHVEVVEQSALSYAITQSYPTGNSAEMTITVLADQAGDPDATSPVSATYSETDEGDFMFRLEYFIPYDEIPDDVEEEIRGAVAGIGAPIAVAGIGGALGELTAGNAAGIRVTVEAFVKKLFETRVEDFLKGLEEGLGSGAIIDSLYKALKAGLEVKDALAVRTEHDELMKRIDALEDCAENPTNPVTRRGYADDPGQKQRILDAIAEARANIKSNFAVMFLGLLNSVGSDLAAGAAGKVLGFIIGPGTEYVKQQLQELNAGWIRDLEKLITPCKDYRLEVGIPGVSGLSAVKCDGIEGEWTIDIWYDTQTIGTIEFTIPQGATSAPSHAVVDLEESGGTFHYDLAGEATFIFIAGQPATLDLGPMPGTFTATIGGVTRSGPTNLIRDFFTGAPSEDDLGAWPLEEGDFC